MSNLSESEPPVKRHNPLLWISLVVAGLIGYVLVGSDRDTPVTTESAVEPDAVCVEGIEVGCLGVAVFFTGSDDIGTEGVEADTDDVHGRLQYINLIGLMSFKTVLRFAFNAKDPFHTSACASSGRYVCGAGHRPGC